MQSNRKPSERRRIVAAASSGGHWVQLRRLIPAFEGNEVFYLSTAMDLNSQVQQDHFVHVRDANFSQKISLIRMAFQMLFITAKLRPDVVISTGAAIGFFAIVFGKLFGAKTIWIDSIANAEELSLAGQKVRVFADHWLTQWPHLANDSGPRYIGSVL